MTGNVKNGFTAEFVPIEVGIHMILVEYNRVQPTATPLCFTKIMLIPTLIGTNSAVNPLLTLTVTLTGILLVGPRNQQTHFTV